MERRSFTLAVVLLTAIITVRPTLLLGQSGANYSLSFNGTNDLVVVPNRPLLELTDGTLELWFKPDWAPGSIAYDPVLIANRQGAVLTRYSLQVDRNLAGVALANGSSVSTVAHAFTRGEWVHLALVESGPTAQVYVNGQSIGSTSNGFGTIIGLPLQLGSDGTGEFFRGQMDEVRIWSIARSATEIRYSLSRALAGDEPGLVAYWRLNEGMGTTAADATTNGFDGTLYGPTWTNSDVTLVNSIGSLGMALDLTAGRSNYVQVASAPNLALTNQFSFEAWIRPRSAQCSTILSRGDGANLAATDYIFQVGTDGTNCGVMKLALLAGGTWTTSASTVPLNEWTHVAVTFDGFTNRFYINGVLDRQVAAVGVLYQSGSALLIGRQGIAGGNYFDGTLDEVRVWNTARSAAEIQSNLNRTLPPNQTGLVGYWRFNEQAGIRAVDSSGRNNHGTLINRPVRVVSFWAPIIAVNSSNPLTQECHTSLADAGAMVNGTPIAFDAGDTHTLAVKVDGGVAGWGAGGPGTSGVPNYGQATVPASATGVVAIAAGYSHSLALKSDGVVLSWGDNGEAEASVPSNAINAVAISAGAYFSLALKGDGTVVGWGRNDFGQTDPPANASNIVAVTAGDSFVLALNADGTVLGWGSGGPGTSGHPHYGQTTIPANASNAIAIAAGGGHSLALKADGTVLDWGRNDFGQVNVPATANGAVAIAAGADHNLALKSNGTVIGWGRNDYGQINVPMAATNIIAIAAGGVYSMALRSDGVIFAWGRNDFGTLAVPGNLSQLNVPVAVRGSVNPDAIGTYVLNYTATNASGAVATTTHTVIVADTAPPVLALLGANPLNVDLGTAFSDPGATAADACEGDVTPGIVRSGAVNAAVPGAYPLTYTVTDSTGNTATTNRTVLVRGSPAVLGFNAFFSGTNAVTGSPVVQFLADVNPNGLATLAFALYGLTTTYPGRTASVNLPASYNTSTFFATLDGLVPGATYHFRVAASNSLGVVFGPDRTFTVPALFAAGDLNGDGRVDPIELDKVLADYWLTTPSLVITNPSPAGGGLFQFALTNVNGWNFNVLVSTNLTDWEQLPEVARPVWQFLDPAATNQPQRYYRLQWAPTATGGQ